MAGKRAVERHVAVSGLEDATHVEVGVFYDRGGISYFTYKNEPGGYWAAVKPVKIKPPMGTSFWGIEFKMLDDRGFKLHLKPATRYSEKTLLALWREVDKVAEAVAERIAAGDKDGAAKLLLPLRVAAAA